MDNQRLLRIDDVMDLTTLSKDSIYKKMKAGKFPRSRRLGKQSVAWLRSDILEWIESLPFSEPNDWETPIH